MSETVDPVVEWRARELAGAADEPAPARTPGAEAPRVTAAQQAALRKAVDIARTDPSDLRALYFEPRTLDSLIRAGLIERTGGSGMQTALRLTPAGRAAAENAPPPAEPTRARQPKPGSRGAAEAAWERHAAERAGRIADDADTRAAQRDSFLRGYRSSANRPQPQLGPLRPGDPLSEVEFRLSVAKEERDALNRRQGEAEEALIAERTEQHGWGWARSVSGPAAARGEVAARFKPERDRLNAEIERLTEERRAVLRAEDERTRATAEPFVLRPGEEFHPAPTDAKLPAKKPPPRTEAGPRLTREQRAAGAVAQERAVADVRGAAERLREADRLRNAALEESLNATRDPNTARTARDAAKDAPETASATTRTARGRETRFTFLTREAAEGTAERLSKLPAATFYSNPLDPRLIKSLLLDPAFDAVRGLRNALGASTALQPIRDAGRAVERAWRWFTQSNRAAMRAIERRYSDVPEITELIDHIATDPGTGRVVRETFESDFEGRAKAMMNRLGNLAGRDLDDAGWERLRDLLTGTARPRDAAEAARVQSVRKLLDEQHAYLTKAGVDLGYVRGRYFPRVLDTETVLANSERFQADAAALYRRMGLGAADARQAAEDWFNRVLGVGRGGRDYAHAPAGRFTKGRTLPSDADRLMRAWYATDPREALSIYFRSSSRIAEFTRRFGRNGEKADALFDAMLRKGVRPDDVALLRAHFESATGTMRTTVSGPVRAAAQWAQTLGTLALLPRAVISSSVEALTIGSRAGNAFRGLEAFADTWKALAGAKSMQDARQMAEMWGVISDAMTDQALLARMGGGIETRAQRRVVTGMFRVTGLHGLTEAQRVAATRIGQVFVRQLADEVAEGAGTAASARRLLAELGMEEADARALAAWLKRNGGQPKMADLLGDAPEAHAYRTAVTRFVNESIQNPEAVDRPALANAPVGRLAYGITSFMFAFTRNVLLRSVKQGAEAVAGEGYTLADRARLAGPLIGFMVLSAAQFGVSRLRELLLNPQQNQERDPWVRTMLDLDRAGLFGTASPIVNMISSAKYERDPSSLLTGPYLGHYLTNLGKMTLGLVPQPVGPNSPRTNNAEHAIATGVNAVAGS